MLQSFPQQAGKSSGFVPFNDAAFTTDDNNGARTAGFKTKLQDALFLFLDPGEEPGQEHLQPSMYDADTKRYR